MQLNRRDQSTTSSSVCYRQDEVFRLKRFRYQERSVSTFNIIIILIILLNELVIVRSASNWTPTTTLIVSRKVIASDCTKRDSVVINGTSPGPELRFWAGQRIWIRVFNDLEHDNATIHWHGISQFGSPFSDGTSASQYPIPAGSFFDYEFQLPSHSPGTYMYHGHTDLDIISAYGALIIEERTPPPYHYDSEITLLFGDYFHSPDSEISSKLTSRPFKALTKPKSILVNGNALGDCHPNSTFTQCEPGCHHHVIDVEPSKTYRIRTIGITTLSYLYIAIEGHPNLSFIEVDGHYIQNITSDHLEIHSGQRYSFLLKTKSISELQAAPNQNEFFWGRLETRWRPERDKGAFILRYQIESKSKPSTLTEPPLNPNASIPTLDPCRTPAPENMTSKAPIPDETHQWILDDLSPLSVTDVAPPASKVSHRIILSSQQSKTAGGGVEWLVNGVAYADSTEMIPYLVAAYNQGSSLHPDYETASENNGFDPKTSTFPIRYGAIVEMVVLNRASSAGTTEAHPWHFHGQSPYYIASGTGDFNPQSLKRALIKRKGKPYRRDTQVVFSGKGATWRKPTSIIPAGTVSGWVLMRMRATTVGAFLVHCHIALHMIMGMAATLLIGVEDLPQIPQEIVEEYMTFDRDRKRIPTSYFDMIPNARKSHQITA